MSTAAPPTPVVVGQIYLDAARPLTRRGIVVAVGPAYASILWLCGSTTSVLVARLQGPAFSLESDS